MDTRQRHWEASEGSSERLIWAAVSVSEQRFAITWHKSFIWTQGTQSPWLWAAFLVFFLVESRCFIHGGQSVQCSGSTTVTPDRLERDNDVSEQQFENTMAREKIEAHRQNPFSLKGTGFWFSVKDRNASNQLELTARLALAKLLLKPQDGKKKNKATVALPVSDCREAKKIWLPEIFRA